MLISEKLGRASEAKSEVVKRLNDSIVYLHHILQQPYHLREEIYDKINAHTLINFLQNSLTDPEQRFEYRSEKYDFRTVELARMLFLISSRYLLKNSRLTDEKVVKDDFERTAYHFRKLSETILEQNADPQIIKDAQQMKNELYKSGLEKEYQKLNRQRSELIEQKKEATFKDDIKKLNQEIDKVTKESNYFMEKINKKEYAIKQTLSHKYDHLKRYYCPIDCFESFIGEKNPYLDDDPSEIKYLM